MIANAKVSIGSSLTSVASPLQRRPKKRFVHCRGWVWVFVRVERRILVSHSTMALYFGDRKHRAKFHDQADLWVLLWRICVSSPASRRDPGQQREEEPGWGRTSQAGETNRPRSYHLNQGAFSFLTAISTSAPEYQSTARLLKWMAILPANPREFAHPSPNHSHPHFPLSENPRMIRPE